MDASSPFPRLLSPLAVRSVTLPNRIVSTAHVVRMSPDHQVNYYAEKARGGVGLIVSEALLVHPTTVPSTMLVGYEPNIIPRLRSIADAVHVHNVPVFSQILHSGRQTSSHWSRLPLWAPSPVAGFYNNEIPHEMTESEIGEIVRAHAATARNVAESGYDGIEIHAAHGYLLQQFMSKLSNRRTDRYGGSLENRLRFAREVIKAVRDAAPSLVVGLRISADEFSPGGLTITDMCEIAPLLAAGGELDYMSVSQSNYEGTSLSTMVPDMYFAPGAFTHLAKQIKKSIPGLPVLTVGRINSPALAEAVLTEAGVDLVGMNRATIADPQLGRKARAGESDRIRPCIAVSVCWGGGRTGRAFSCAVNPTVGLESEWGDGTIARTTEPRFVLVVGGGPAGVEAARVLGESGHRVLLVERADRVGGQLNLAARAPNREDFGHFVNWAEGEIRRLGVEIRLGVQADVPFVLAQEPDAIVVATGSLGSVGDISESKSCLTSARSVLSGDVLLDGRVLVVDREWEWQATSTAEFLVSQGLQVEIATEKMHLGLMLPGTSLPTLQSRLDQLGVRVHTMARCTAISGRTVTFYHSYSRRTFSLDGFDALVVAGESVVDGELYAELKSQHPAVWAVGDCVAPRHLIEAVYDGHKAAREIISKIGDRTARETIDWDTPIS